VTKKQFRHDFLRGLGSALLELQSCDNAQKYYDTVHYGCLHVSTYDMQSEGDRGWYLYTAAAAVGGASILHDIIERYARTFSFYDLFNQLSGILYHYAKEGSTAARNALYEKYSWLIEKLFRSAVSRHRTIFIERSMFEWLCVWLTSLDGFDAFKRIVMDISEKLLPKDPVGFFDAWLYSNAQDKFGAKRVESFLQKQAKKSAYINIYLQEAHKWDNYVSSKAPDPTLEDVIAEVDGERFHGRGLAMRFARNAGMEDLEKLFSLAMEQQDLQSRAELLWGLRRSKLQWPEAVIEELLQSENEDIRDTAIYIMEQSPSPKRREYALKLINEGTDLVDAISILALNILPQDEQLFCATVKAIPVKLNEGDWHCAFMAAEDALKRLRGKPKTDLLLYIYRETYCGSCRESIVALMHKKRALTGSLLQECLYDSNGDIRSFAERVVRREKQS
jgi:hypothetical protein